MNYSSTRINSNSYNSKKSSNLNEFFGLSRIKPLYKKLPVHILARQGMRSTIAENMKYMNIDYKCNTKEAL